MFSFSVVLVDYDLVSGTRRATACRYKMRFHHCRKKYKNEGSSVSPDFIQKPFEDSTPQKNQHFQLCNGGKSRATQSLKIINKDLATRMPEIIRKLQKNTQTTTVGTFARLELSIRTFTCSIFCSLVWL